MALKPGDRVSLSISPVIALGRFVNCKAHATLTRELGEDVDAELAAMEAELVPLYRRALLVELEQLNELQDIVGVPGERVNWATVEQLADYCVRSRDGITEEDREARRVQAGRRGGKKLPCKKGASKKGLRKKGPRRRGG